MLTAAARTPRPFANFRRPPPLRGGSSHKLQIEQEDSVPPWKAAHRAARERRDQLRADARRPVRLLGDIAAVDDQFGAGDERGFVGGEEQHPVGDLDRLADPWTL